VEIGRRKAAEIPITKAEAEDMKYGMQTKIVFERLIKTNCEKENLNVLRQTPTIGASRAISKENGIIQIKPDRSNPGQNRPDWQGRGRVAWHQG
jgi:hypothetical protein